MLSTPITTAATAARGPFPRARSLKRKPGNGDLPSGPGRGGLGLGGAHHRRADDAAHGLILLYNLIHEWRGLARPARGLPPAALSGVRLDGADGVTGHVLWCGLALASYVMGLSWLARKETGRGPAPYWPGVFWRRPLALAGLTDDGPTRQTGTVLSLVLVIWMFWAFRHAFWRAEPMVGYAVARLLAGIPLVDLLAVADLTRPRGRPFPAWFVLALLLQRYIPAT